MRGEDAHNWLSPMATLVIIGGDGGCGFRKQLCLLVKGENMVALTFVGNVSNGDGGANKRFERQGEEEARWKLHEIIGW